MKMARTHVEWVAQVSLLRPGFLPANESQPEHPGLKSVDLGHPLNYDRIAIVD
jgi:hypothetical protein